MSTPWTASITTAPPSSTPDGTMLGVYRKHHIPEGPQYIEKYYFTPGDSPYTVWKTKYGTFGVLICWDEWFPEPTRILAIKGADFVFYPSAIGSEPRQSRP